MLIIRNCGPVGYPGSAEVVNMQPPATLIVAASRRCRRWATGGNPARRAPSILNVSPEAAVGGGLALLKTGDRIRIDLNNRKVDVLIAARRTGGAARGLEAAEAGRTDAVGGDLSEHGRAARHRCVPGAGDAVSRRDRDARGVAQQPLIVST